MQVVMIGAGNIATVLVKVLLANDYTIIQVYSRSKEAASELAKTATCSYTNSLNDIVPHADIYFVAVADEAIETVAQQLSLGNKLVVHTAGTISKNVLSQASTSYGVLWPIKMIRKSMTDFGKVTVAIDASGDTAMDMLRTVASFITNTIVEANDTQRLHMHLVAALTTNFTNHLYALASAYCETNGIDFSLFYTTIEEAAKAIQGNNPTNLQAGPAFRGNMATLHKHQELIADNHALDFLYDAFTKSIMEMYSVKK